MNILCVGGGPAGLYFSILMKQKGHSHDITVFERNKPDDIFGFGVVFSESTLEYLQNHDEDVYQQISRNCQTWDPIEVHFKGKTLRCGGNSFSAISRRKLLTLLQKRAVDLGVQVRFQTEFDDLSLCQEYDLIVAADGANSFIRRTFAEQFQPTIDVGKAKYAWFGTTKVFSALTFLFAENEHGIFGVHAYPFDNQSSTFIVETDEASWQAAGLDRFVEQTLAPGASDLASLSYCQKLFAKDLDGHELLANNSKWLNFRTVRNQTWQSGNIVLLGDAAHTAHFSVGSGTKMALEDAIALSQALDQQPDIATALAAYERMRKPEVERIQRASQPSLAWWEDFRRYKHFSPEQFTFTFLTRNPRMTGEKLQQRDPHFVAQVNRWFANEMRPPEHTKTIETMLPLAAPLRLRTMTLANRIAISCGESAFRADDMLMMNAGLVLFEFAAYNEVPVAALQRMKAILKSNSSTKIGVCIPSGLCEAGHGITGPIIDAYANWLRVAEALEADLIELDLTSEQVAVLDAVRGQWKDKQVLAVRLSLPDMATSVTDDALLETATLFKQHGCDLISLALGPTPTRNDHLRQRQLSDRMRNESHIPTLVRGDLANVDEINTIILSARADLYLLKTGESLDLARSCSSASRSL